MVCSFFWQDLGRKCARYSGNSSIEQDSRIKKAAVADGKIIMLIPSQGLWLVEQVANILLSFVMIGAF